MKHRSSIVVLALAFSSATALPAAAQQVGASAVFRTMSPAEERATGVDKLSVAERTALEAWITRLTTNVATLTVSSVCQPSSPPATSASLESRILGDFTGWDGFTVYALENGQVWRQASFDRVAIHLHRPRVTLMSVGQEWRMAVDGIASSVPVRRVR